MQSRLQVEDPKKIVYTLTTTATAEEWEKFRDALDMADRGILTNSERELVHHFSTQVTDLLAQARKIYWPTDPNTKEPTRAEE